MDPSLITIIQCRNIHFITLQKKLIKRRSRKSKLELDEITLIGSLVILMHDDAAGPSTLSIEADGTMNIDNLIWHTSQAAAAAGSINLEPYHERAVQLGMRAHSEENELVELLGHFEEFERLEDPYYFEEWNGNQRSETYELICYAINLKESLMRLITSYETLLKI